MATHPYLHTLDLVQHSHSLLGLSFTTLTTVMVSKFFDDHGLSLPLSLTQARIKSSFFTNHLHTTFHYAWLRPDCQQILWIWILWKVERLINGEFTQINWQVCWFCTVLCLFSCNKILKFIPISSEFSIFPFVGTLKLSWIFTEFLAAMFTQINHLQKCIKSGNREKNT